MKDLVIKGKSVLREVYVFLALLVVAEIVNLCTILHYGRPAVELVSQIGYVFFFALLLYALIGVVRIIVAWIINLFKTR